MADKPIVSYRGETIDLKVLFKVISESSFTDENEREYLYKFLVG